MTYHYMANQTPHSFLMLGDKGVGKRRIVLRFAEDRFGEILVDWFDEYEHRKRLQVEQYLPGVDIFHPPHTDTPRVVEPYISLGANDGALVVYSITSRSSFEHVRDYVKQVDDTKKKAGNDRFVLFLVGNKSDCEAERQVSKAEGQALAASLHLGFIETSAKTNDNIDEAFRRLVLDVSEQYPERKDKIVRENNESDIVGKMESSQHNRLKPLLPEVAFIG